MPLTNTQQDALHEFNKSMGGLEDDLATAKSRVSSIKSSMKVAHEKARKSGLNGEVLKELRKRSERDRNSLLLFDMAVLEYENALGMTMVAEPEEDAEEQAERVSQGDADSDLVGQENENADSPEQIERDYSGEPCGDGISAESLSVSHEEDAGDAGEPFRFEDKREVVSAKEARDMMSDRG